MQRWRLGLVFLLVLATAAPARADLVDVATVDGTILDATAQQVLYRTTGNAPQVKLLDVAGGQTQTIPLTAASSNDFQRGALIPGGAVIATDTTNFPFRELQEWQSGGVLTNLGGLNSSFDAAGDYVTWTSGQGHDLNRLQVSTSIATPVAANALNTGNHVDAGSGDVVFAGTVSGQSGYEVFRWHNGVTTPLSHQLPARWAIEPEVDGSLVAYALRSPDGTVGGLAFHDGLTETVLDAARWGGATAGDFALSGGWLAFDRAHDPAFQPDEVWTRSPGGTLAQVFHFPGPTGVADRVSVADVNPNGQTLFRADGQGLTGNWLGQPGVAAYPVSSAFLEQSFWSNGHWYVVLYPGDKLQRLDLDTAFTQQPPALTQAPTADIAIASSSAPVSLTCTLDGATYAPCGPAVHLSGLADGTHTFTAAAHDSFETDATPATVTWTVDSQPPAAFGLLSPADGAFINQAPAHFAWEATSDAGSGLDHYLVNVSGQSPTQVPAGQTSVDFNVGEGPHTWSVTAVDHAGLARTTATGSFTVDQTPPDPPQIAAPGPGNTVLTSQPTLSWTAVSDAVGYRVRLGEDDPVSTAATSYVPPALPDGAYSWTVVAIDAAGNVSAPAAAGFEVDTRPNYTLPVGISINDGAQFTNDPDVTLNVRWPKFATQMLASNDGGFGGADPVPVASLLSWHLDQSGSERLPRTVYVRFLGGTAGNETYTDDIILDHTPPVVSKARAKRRGRRFRLQLKASDRTSGVAALQLTQNRGKPGAWKPYKAKRTVRGKPHKPVFARVRDRAGNRSRWRRAKIIRR